MHRSPFYAAAEPLRAATGFRASCSKRFEFSTKSRIWSACTPLRAGCWLPAAARALNLNMNKRNTPLNSGVSQSCSAFPRPRPTGLLGVGKPPLMSSLQRPSPIFACRPNRSIGLHHWLFSAVRRPLRPDPSRLERLCVPGICTPPVALHFDSCPVRQGGSTPGDPSILTRPQSRWPRSRPRVRRASPRQLRR
jgi:hypothetical protein